MINVGIVGCSGYTAIEAIKLLLRHKHVKITAATSRQADGKTLAEMHPELTGRVDLLVENLTPAEVASRCDVAFCCLPHAASAPIVTEILRNGCRAVDLSADYRLSTQQLYEQWYAVEHPDPSRLGQTPYGLPELFRASITSADLVANPGCYPTSAILPLAPLVKDGMIEQQVIVDSKSGVSGAGRTPKLATLYGETNESFAAYSVGTHRHQPEISDIVSRFTGTNLDVVFTPHLVPMDRGILSTIYVRPTGGNSRQSIEDCVADFYGNEQFVKVVSHLPKTKHVAHTNNCDIAVLQNGDWVILVSVIDNLIKGASGAAVQCMNVMFEFDEAEGLI